MSYLIAVKGKYGTVITSDSYSTYLNRTLKDSDYKKIHEIISGKCYIGLTGMNEVLLNNQLVDINNTLSLFFTDITLDNIDTQIDLYNAFLKDSCDKYCMDISYVLAYENVLYDVNILNNDEIRKHRLPSYEYGILILGEREYKEWSLHNIDSKITQDNLPLLKLKCNDIVQQVINIENIQHPENQRVVGGDVQQIAISATDYENTNLSRKLI